MSLSQCLGRLRKSKAYILGFIIASIFLASFNCGTLQRLKINRANNIPHCSISKIHSDLTSKVNALIPNSIFDPGKHIITLLDIPKIIDQTYTDDLLKSLKSYFLDIYSSSHENKYALYRRGFDHSSPCNLVTLGIGNDIDSELVFKTRNSNCQLFGAEPVLANGLIYKKVGTFFPFAVSSSSNSTKSSMNIILSPEKQYRYESLTSIGFSDLLMNKVNQTQIDHLWIDVEGQEWAILPELLQELSLFSPSFTVCQLNIEFHLPVTPFTRNSSTATRTLRQFLLGGTFLAISSYQCNLFPDCPHISVFAINIRSKYCTSKYVDLCNL